MLTPLIETCRCVFDLIRFINTSAIFFTAIGATVAARMITSLWMTPSKPRDSFNNWTASGDSSSAIVL